MQLILLLILAGATFSLALMGASQRWRLRRLAGVAHALGLNFSREDPFDLPRRYGEFAVMQAGHCSCAHNVMFGRFGGFYLRVFDYRFEVGHGPRRMIRRFTIITAETSMAMGRCMAWRPETAQPGALPVGDAFSPVPRWLAAGETALASRLAECWPDRPDRPVGMETHGELVVFSSPQRPAPGVAEYVRAVAGYLGRLTGQTENNATRTQPAG